MNLELKIIPVVQVLICLVLIWLIDSISPEFRYTFSNNPNLSNYLCIVIVTISVVIASKAIIDFKNSATTVNPTTPEQSTTVVDTGIYAYSRNPMYLAMLLALVACACWFENLLGFVVLPLFIAYISKYQIIPEERALAELFGENYLQYKTKVRRWL